VKERTISHHDSQVNEPVKENEKKGKTTLMREGKKNKFSVW
jgi:hypothetical protein